MRDSQDEEAVVAEVEEGGDAVKDDGAELLLLLDFWAALSVLNERLHACRCEKQKGVETLVVAGK